MTNQKLAREIANRTEHARKNRVCANCGSPVTRRFARVFGDNDDVVWACHACTPRQHIRAGACQLSVRAGARMQDARLETETGPDDFVDAELDVVDDHERELINDEEYSFYSEPSDEFDAGGEVVR
jgi:RNase P subunit RPR2